MDTIFSSLIVLIEVEIIPQITQKKGFDIQPTSLKLQTGYWDFSKHLNIYF